MTGATPRQHTSRGRLRPVPEPDRQPPHNLEAEEAVLGAILASGRLLADVAGLLEEADFYRPAHRAIWRAILRLADRGKPTDPVTVLGELDHAGELADVGGGPFLHTLIEAVPTVANAGHYAHLVADTARRRRVIDLGIQLAHSDADPAVLAHLANQLADTSTAAHGGHRWEPPVPFGSGGAVPPFPVEVLPGWLGDYVAGLATATQTPPDLAGMLALAVLATVAAGSVEVEPRPGWREPLCLFVAVGMDAGTRKSAVFTALTRPVAEFERDQAAAALPGITETATLRRIAESAAAHAEAAAGKAPASQQEEARAEAIARAAEASALVVPPLPRWLVDDATPEALAGLLASYGRIALLSPEGDVFDQMAGRYNQAAGPNLGVYLKGHAGDLLKVDRRGRPPEYVERPCLTIGLAVQPEVLRGLAGRPGFGGRGLLARFLYSLPESLVGRRQPGAPPVPQPVADRYTLELHALAASLNAPAGEDGPAVLTLDQAASELLLGFERDLEPRLAAGSGDLAQLAGWAAKLAGATCRLAGLLHLAAHLRDGWVRPIGADTFAAAVWLAGYLVEHARAVFDLMGADARVDDARWLLDWIGRTNRAQFTRRDAQLAAPRGRFPKATSLDPALALLQEHGYLRRLDPDPSRDPHGRGRPPPRASLSTLSTRPQKPQKPRKPPPNGILWVLWFLWTQPGASNETSAAPLLPAVTLSNENGPSRSRASTPRTRQPPGRRGALTAVRRPVCRSAVPLRGRSHIGVTMASAGIRKTPTGRYKVWWRLDDGSQGSQTFGSRDAARDFKNDLLTRLGRGNWVDPRLGKQPFETWAREWWDGWSVDPDHSPRTLQAAEARLRLHLLPALGRRQLRAISVSVVRYWQNELRGRVGYDTVMACRSLLYRILQAAEDDRRIEVNPVRKVPAPKPPVDPAALLGRAKRRAYTPEEFGYLLAGTPPFYRDHFITAVGTGLRAGELLGLRALRVDLDRQQLEVLEVRYDAGRFGSGYKDRPKSAASIRVVPLAGPVVDALQRRLPPDGDPDGLVFTGPGGSNRLPRGARSAMSRHGLLRVYKHALLRVADPVASLPYTPRRVLAALRDGGPQTVEQVRERLCGRTPRAATVLTALDRLHTAGLAAADQEGRWTACDPPRKDDLLGQLQLRGPHDLRHTFATWLEDAGVPARVIDELMGHAGGRRGGGAPSREGSLIGNRYRWTTPDMEAYVVAAIEQRLAISFAVAARGVNLGRSEREEAAEDAANL